MARQDVYRKYDENGNVVDEVRLDEGTSEYEAAKKAREAGGGQVGNYYIKNGTGDITKKNNLADYASDLTELYTPVIKVNKAGDGLVISGSKTAINNDMTKQLQSYLDNTFKYADLKSESVAEALDALNKDLYSQVEERVVSNGIGMNYDDYKEYRNTLQQLQGTNPLKSTGVVPGYDRDGKKVYKTIADWIAYYRSYYSTSERADLFRGALTLMEGGNTDPALWTPYLAMSGGTGASPVYGFDTGERLSTGWESFMNEMAKLIQGGAQNAVRTVQYLQNIGGYNRRDKLNKVAHEIELGRKVNSSEVKWMSEDNFNKKLESIIGKRVGELNSSEKTFLATAVAGNMNSDQMKDVMAAISDNGVITDDIRNLATYKSYIDERDNLSTTEKYDVEMDKAVDAVNSGRDWLQRDVNLGSIYAPVETTVGAFAGTMLRMWAEAGLIKYATGGIFNPAEISDFLAGKLISGLEKVAPASGALRALQTPVGSFLLSVTAELPEDVVQTVIDDVMTGRGEDIPLLAPTGDINKDMEKLGESFAQNLAFRLAFTPLHVGAQKLRAWRAAKNAASAVDMDATVSDQLFVRNQQLKDAADKGNIIDLTEDSATIRNPDGTETVLDNVAMLHFGTDPELQERYPAIAEMVRKKGLVNDIAESDIQQRVDRAKTAVENGEYADMSAGIVKNANGELVDLTGKPVNVEATSDDGIVVYRGQPKGEDGAFIPNDPTNKSEWGDVFFFIENPNYASSFGDDIVYFEFPKEKVVTLSEYADIKNMANDIVGDELEFNKYVAEHGEAAGALLEEISYDNARAVAEYTGKPIVETAWKGDASGSEYSYFPGIDSEFDESAVTHSLSSTSSLAPQASAANIEMSNQIQKALDTQPYGDSVAEIVADKYRQGAAEMSEAPSSGSYKWESPDVTKVYKTEEEVFADRPVGKNMTEVRQWQKNAEAFYMNKYREDVVPKFRESYPTVDEQQQFVRNMDFLFDQQRVGGEDLVVKPVEAEPGGYQISGSVIGKTYENEGITYTVNEDDVRFYLDNIEPMMKNLREAGAAGQGREAFTITGYLPHSDYDPTLLTAEDAMQQGVLWREYTGASTTAEDGTFTTGWLDSDLEARYRTFVNNMLWDSLGEEVTIAKFMEELNADGLDVDVDKVARLVGGRKRFAEIISKSDSAKAVVKNLVGDGKLPTDGELDEAAAKMGATDKVHELYQPVYGSSTGLNQRGNVALMSKSDWMRSLSTGDGSLYDNGGAMIVNGSADAKFMAKRIFEAVENGEKLDTHKMFVEYLTQNHRRTAKGASYIADKWMDKIAQKTSNGGITRRALTAELSRLIYNEGANRVFRFIGRMDTSKLNASNRKALDSLLFRHSMLSKVMNTSGFTAKLNRATNKLISARMKSLFWLNFKNAVLQSSECIRLFTEFKLGDALDTIKRMSSDKEFMKEVDEWVDMLVPERYIKGDSSAAIDAAATIAGKSSYANGELTVEKLSRGEINGISKKFDEFASSPVEMGESLKNRVLMAGILQEAHSKGLSGNELFSYVNERFQRIGLAANEMGRLNASDSPLFRLGANLKTFQIRQLSMFLNNINDMNGPKEAVTYILKNLGWKAGLVVILSKLGYSAAATLGIDPFDLMDDDYTGVDEDNYTGLDYLVLSPAGKLFLSGGFTGYINDLYWASRKAYEDSAEITEETENRLDKGFWPGMALPGTSFDDVLNSFTGFIPGYTAGKRVVQMNELLDTGWATSATGNKMYTAPDNIFDIAGGYAFGRSNTPNARAYYQTPDYLQGFIDNGFEGVGQQIGREWGAYRQFDPIDSYGYSDWFNGSAADEQQWNSGYYYFLNKVRDMNREYSNSLSEYTTDEQKQSLRDSYNKRLAEVEEQISRFTRAYESKHPEGIDARKMKNLVNVLNIYQPVVSDTPEEAEQRSLDAYSDALYRYTQAGLPAVTSYKRNDEGEVEEVYSPQVRSAIQGQFGLPEEAATQIKQLYKDKWKELNQQYRNRLFSTSGSKAKKAIQNEYINIVRQDLDPIVRLYGNNIWSNEDVENIIDDVFNSMIPKYGQTPKSYLKNLYKNYTGAIRYNESGNTTLSQINNLLDQGKTAQAKALARTLLQRVQENRTYLNRSEMERLQAILND